MNDKRHDHEAAKALYASARSATDEPYSESEARRWRIMVALWERMGQFFGQQWEKSYGTVEDGTIHAWMGALSSFTEDEIAGAVKAVGRDFKGAFPPAFPEFRDLCQTAREHVKVRQVYQQAEANAVPLADLSRQHRADSEVAKQEKAKQRDGGGMTKRESYEHLQLAKRWGPPPAHWE